MANRNELREKLLAAIEEADAEKIALVVSRLLAQLEDAAAQRVVDSLVGEIGEGENQDYDPVAAGKEMAKQEIGDRRGWDAFR